MPWPVRASRPPPLPEGPNRREGRRPGAAGAVSGATVRAAGAAGPGGTEPEAARPGTRRDRDPPERGREGDRPGGRTLRHRTDPGPAGDRPVRARRPGWRAVRPAGPSSAGPAWREPPASIHGRQRGRRPGTSVPPGPTRGRSPDRRGGRSGCSDPSRCRRTGRRRGRSPRRRQRRRPGRRRRRGSGPRRRAPGPRPGCRARPGRPGRPPWPVTVRAGAVRARPRDRWRRGRTAPMRWGRRRPCSGAARPGAPGRDRRPGPATLRRWAGGSGSTGRRRSAP